MTNTFGLNGLPLQQALEPWVASLPSMCWIVESTLGNYHFGRLSIAMIHVGCILFKAIPLCAPCTRKWLNILLWWQTFVRKIVQWTCNAYFPPSPIQKDFLILCPARAKYIKESSLNDVIQGPKGVFNNKVLVAKVFKFAPPPPKQ